MALLEGIMSKRVKVQLNIMDHLINKFQGQWYLTIKDLTQVLPLKEETIRNQISDNSFPIHTFKVANKRVAKVDDVANYINREYIKTKNEPESAVA